MEVLINPSSDDVAVKSSAIGTGPRGLDGALVQKPQRLAVPPTELVSHLLCDMGSSLIKSFSQLEGILTSRVQVRNRKLQNPQPDLVQTEARLRQRGFWDKAIGAACTVRVAF